MSKRFLMLTAGLARQLARDTEALFAPIEGVPRGGGTHAPPELAVTDRRVAILRSRLANSRVLVITEADWETARITLPAWNAATSVTSDLFTGTVSRFPGRDQDDPGPRVALPDRARGQR